MADFVAIPISPTEPGNAQDIRTMAIFQTAESDLVSQYSGGAEIQEMTVAAGRLEAIAQAADEVYRSTKERLAPDEIEMEIAVGLSGEVGWFVAKSSATGSLKLTLKWTANSSMQ
jgi:hypothetical protein